MARRPRVPAGLGLVASIPLWRVLGLVVGVVALPLAMAFAIASGVPPERGLYTAVVAGFLISVLGGSRVQIGGPTGAFIVFMKRMADVTDIQAITREFREEDDLNGADPGAIAKRSVPKEVEVYEVNGPFFFGVADRVKDVLAIIGKPPKVFILRMRNVPAMDATGMNALMDLHAKCVRQGTILILAADVDEALARARSILDGSANGASPWTATGPGGHR